MSEERNTQTGGGNGGGASDNPPPAVVVGAKPLIRLAHHATLRIAIEGTDRTEPAFREPVTVEGVANIYGRPPVYFPGLAEQKSGFTPYFVARQDGRALAPAYDDAKRAADLKEGETLEPLKLERVELPPLEEGAPARSLELDPASGQEAARLVLTQFVGTYKPHEEKGA
jgi:hypothetical protein